MTRMEHRWRVDGVAAECGHNVSGAYSSSHASTATWNANRCLQANEPQLKCHACTQTYAHILHFSLLHFAYSYTLERSLTSLLFTYSYIALWFTASSPDLRFTCSHFLPLALSSFHVPLPKRCSGSNCQVESWWFWGADVPLVNLSIRELIWRMRRNPPRCDANGVSKH